MAKNPPLTKKHPAFYERHPLLSPAVQSVFQFGYLPKVIQKAVNNLLKDIGGKILKIFF